MRNIALHDCVHLNKPVKLGDLTREIEKLLAKPPDLKSYLVFTLLTPWALRAEPESLSSTMTTRFVRRYEPCLKTMAGRRTMRAARRFLRPLIPASACLLIDAYLPGMSGLELLEKLRDDGHPLPAIMITGNADVAMAVQAMKAGALDFIEKPIGRGELIASIERALELSQDPRKLLKLRESASLTSRVSRRDNAT